MTHKLPCLDLWLISNSKSTVSLSFFPIRLYLQLEYPNSVFLLMGFFFTKQTKKRCKEIGNASHKNSFQFYVTCIQKKTTQQPEELCVLFSRSFGSSYKMCILHLNLYCKGFYVYTNNIIKHIYLNIVCK